MKIEISEGELGLCIGALELGARELREGLKASDNLKIPMPHGVVEMVDQMVDLRNKLLAFGQSTAPGDEK